ncbi:oligosaccharide flippase family protein [Alkalihalophilus sp. As8PL]|uniref:Oligosaccharide flippase family protein n=1 Tax=Alkalihalophilus sp. As8PL TaxID=3237103 RepID=A0AB39BPI4_9BACI
MVSKHAFMYVFSHGIPALIGFLSIAVFTRLLSPEQYGVYALVIAITALVNAVVFEWIKLSLLRYYSQYKMESKFLSTLKLSFLGLVLLTTIIGVMTAIIFPNISLSLVVLCLLLSWLQSWGGVNLSLMRAQLNPKSYGYYSFTRATLGIVLGTLLISSGFGAVGLLIGLIIALLLTFLRPTIQIWKVHLNTTDFDHTMFKSFLMYGLPLTLTLLMTVVIHNSDRLIIGYLMTTAATGVYSVTYDLIEQSIFTLMMVVNLAALPIAMKVMEEKGEKASYQQVKRNTSLIFFISIPAALGVWLLSDNLVYLLLGEQYRQAARLLIPYIVVIALLRGFKLYCIDIMFYLKKKTSLQVIPVVVAGVLNIVLNFVLIPVMGLEGAAIATVASYVTAILLSWMLVHIQIHPIPIPIGDLIKIVSAGLIMGLCLWPIRDHLGVISLIYQVTLGVLTYGIAAYVVNAFDLRDWANKKLYSQSKSDINGGIK